ncbi:hypothetical protein Scep_021818 [Stephania cephalantha]|uniref:Uncharacterized protein n=1 Tax=Stephania cephalantha TaxID=152367 RepID=A0AAP0F509_9MAGN
MHTCHGLIVYQKHYRIDLNAGSLPTSENRMASFKVQFSSKHRLNMLEIKGESEVEGVVGAVVLVVGGQGGEGGVVAVAPRPREVGEEGVSEELIGAVEPVGEMGAEAVEEEPATPD